jgi:hypothetical protein
LNIIFSDFFHQESLADTLELPGLFVFFYSIQIQILIAQVIVEQLDHLLHQRHVTGVYVILSLDVTRIPNRHTTAPVYYLTFRGTLYTF